MRLFATALFLMLFCLDAQAQLGFCNGSKGDPVFTEDFGSGTGFGPALPAGTTSYNFVSGTPNDGDYTLNSNTMMNGNWLNRDDHTPGDVNGKALIVNASFTAGEFYRREVNGLCVNTTFEFTAWLINAYNPGNNACPGTGIPINVKFQIWDQTETQLLAEGDTGNINGSTGANWTQYGLTFTTLPGQTSVVLKMINNGVGGCGNDLAIDDIMFRSCGDIASVTSDSNAVVGVCSNELPVSLSLDVNISGTTSHVFQWQQSTDGTVWTDIPGETSMNYTTPPLFVPMYFRVKVAEDIANMSNAYCYTLSEHLHFWILTQPVAPTNDGNIGACDSAAIPPLQVTPTIGNIINWYDAASGGNLLVSGSTTYQTSVAGTYYAEASNGVCESPTRTAVTLTIFPAPVFPDPNPDAIEICQGQTATIDAGIPGESYNWQPGGATTQTISVLAAGDYTVTVTSGNGCSDSLTYSVIVYDAPQIESVQTDGSTVTILTTTTGSFEYSIDGSYWQSLNVFENLSGGAYTAYVRETHGCGNDDEPFLLILAPAFFTPNGDGYNDFFTIPGIEQTADSRVEIFDRYGQYLGMITSQAPNWDGKLNGKELPSTDYWFKGVFDDGTEVKGHFSLKR